MIRLLALITLLNLLLLPFLTSAANNTETTENSNKQESTNTSSPVPQDNRFAMNPFQRSNAYRHHPNVYFPDRFSYQSDPTQVIKDTLEKITAFTTHSGNVNPVELRRFIETEIIPHFDFDNMAHWITGPYAQYMSTEEKINFQKQLRETFLSSLAKHLGSFDAENTRIRFTPAQYRGQEEAFVRTIVYRPNIRPMRLNFRMRQSGNDWKIIDVRADGASAVLYYRKHFMSQLRQYRQNY